MFTAEHVLAVNCHLGEGPIWDHNEQKLYWVDIFQNTIHTYHPESKKHETNHFNDHICAMGLRAKGGMVLATRKHFAFWDGQSSELEYIHKVEADMPENRFNDGAVDRQGRFWAGTMHSTNPSCSLYRLDANLTVSKQQTGVTISNGIGWSPDSKTMYHTDSPLKMIYAYDFNAETGAISNRRPHIHTPDEQGVPDGLTIDSEGYLWSARWGGYNVTRYTPDGHVDRIVEIPVEKVTSVSLGGENLTDLYVTTARAGYSDNELEQYPQAGDLFRIAVEVPGLPEVDFAG